MHGYDANLGDFTMADIISKRIVLQCLTALFFVLPNLGSAVPAQILIIRHGEKPPGEAPNLNEKGRQRSGALAFYFQLNPLVTDFGPPVAIYTFKSSGERGTETIAPTAQALSLPVHVLFKPEEVAKTAQVILNHPGYEGRMVLICWEHHNIQGLCIALGGPPTTPAYPDPRFDLVYKLTYTNPSAPDFCVGLQELMFDDSSTFPFAPGLQCP